MWTENLHMTAEDEEDDQLPRRPSIPVELTRHNSLSRMRAEALVEHAEYHQSDTPLSNTDVYQKIPLDSDSELTVAEEEEGETDKLAEGAPATDFPAYLMLTNDLRAMGKEEDTVVRDVMWKILIVGDSAVGKTALVCRWAHDVFSTNYKSTIGVDFALKKYSFKDGMLKVSLQLWDVAGQERFGSMTRVYYKEARAAIVVCDPRPQTYESTKVWKRDIDEKVCLPDGKRNIPVLLLINKCDMPFPPEYPEEEQIRAYVREGGFIGAMRVSAKDKINTNNALLALVKYMLKKKVDRLPKEKKAERQQAREGIVQLGGGGGGGGGPPQTRDGGDEDTGRELVHGNKKKCDC